MEKVADESVRDRLLIKSDIADLLRISSRTLDNMIRAGTFPKPDRMIGRHPRWKWDTLSGWIDGQSNT
jgi:predicted DNA-binding transcriptional regulator AlpA